MLYGDSPMKRATLFSLFCATTAALGLQTVTGIAPDLSGQNERLFDSAGIQSAVNLLLVVRAGRGHFGRYDIGDGPAFVRQSAW